MESLPYMYNIMGGFIARDSVSINWDEEVCVYVGGGWVGGGIGTLKNLGGGGE